MKPPVSKHGVKDQLHELPDKELFSIVRKLEKSKKDPKNVDSVDTILKSLRPRLVELRPERVMTLTRLFCRPFEELLISASPSQRASGKILRSSINPIWALVVAELDPVLKEQTEAVIAEDGGPHTPDTAEYLAFWKQCGSILSNLVEADQSSGKLSSDIAEKLGEAADLETLKLMRDVFLSVETVRSFCKNFPQGPVDRISDDDVRLVGNTLKVVAAISMEAVAVIVFLLLARFRDARGMLHLFEKLQELGMGDLVGLLSTDAGKTVVSQQEGRVNGVREQSEAPRTKPSDLIRTVGSELALLKSSEALTGTGGEQGRKMARMREELNIIAREAVSVSPDEDPVAALSDTSNKKGDAIERLQAAEDRVVSLLLAQRYSENDELDREVAKSLAKVGEQLENRASEVIDSLSTDPDSRIEDLFDTVRLLELTEGPDAADAVRMKGLHAYANRE